MRSLVASLLLLVACASSGAHVGGEQPAVSILTVQNQRTEDLTIYVMHDGYKGRRLGQVTGLASATFILSELDAPPSTDVQFLAMSFVSAASELSDPVIAARGASYEWRLAPGKNHQFAFRRYQRT
jgi:hypothetical protein